MATDNSKNVSDNNKTIAKTAAVFFGGEASVHNYVKDNGESSIAILACSESPQSGLTSYSTIGLSDHQFKVTKNEIPLGVEIIGVCGSSFELFPNILGSISTLVKEDGQECAPDTIFRDVVTNNQASQTMNHILLVDPFLWPESPETLRFKEKAVAWLQAVPIADNELEYSNKEGLSSLHELFTKNQIDVFNLNRGSVV